MGLRYRVFGKINNSFILRGLHFESGREIDFVVSESELAFVKERCDITEVKELKPNVNTKTPKSQNVAKESQNDKPRTSTSATSKTASNAKIPVVAKRGG